jgi:hypothetical protein
MHGHKGQGICQAAIHVAISGRELRRIPQPVEKVGVGRITTNNRAWKALKSGRLVADLGLKRASGEFFNTLGPFAKFRELRKAEVQLPRILFRRNTKAPVCRTLRLSVAFHA